MVATRVYFEASSSIVLQHAASAAFNGSEVGRASVSNGASNSQVIFRARNLGSYPNAGEGDYQVAILTPKNNPLTYARFDVNNNQLTIYARTNASGTVLATSSEVASAVNDDNRWPMSCAAGGTGLGTVAAFGPTALSGGVDPVILRNAQYKFPVQANAGLFFFDQGTNLLVRQVEAHLGVATAWTVKAVNLDEGLSAVSGEDVLIASGTGTDIALINLNFVLAPLRAIKLEAAQAGVARVVVHREPNFPNV